MRDVPVGEPFEIETGRATPVFTQERVISDTQVDDGEQAREVIKLEVTAFNHMTTPADVEIRHSGGFQQGFKVKAESQRHTSKGGDPVWRLTLPAGGEKTLTYTVSFDQ